MVYIYIEFLNISFDKCSGMICYLMDTMQPNGDVY